MIHDTVLTFSDGKLALPKEVQEEMQLEEGTRLRLVSSTNAELHLRREDKPETIGGREPIWLEDRWYVPNDEWRSLRGILSGHPEHDTTAARKAEREWELEHDERKFGPFPKRED